MTKRENIPYLQHIADAIKNVEIFTKNLTKEKFLKNKLRQSAVVRQLEIIGEATKNTSTEFRNKYPEVEWSEIIRTRDKIIHHYFGINLNIIWDIIKNNLPELKQQIQKILKKESK